MYDLTMASGNQNHLTFDSCFKNHNKNIACIIIIIIIILKL